MRLKPALNARKNSPKGQLIGRAMNQPAVAVDKTRRQRERETRRGEEGERGRGGTCQAASTASTLGDSHCQPSQPPRSTKAKRGNGCRLLVFPSPSLPLSPSPCLPFCSS